MANSEHFSKQISFGRSMAGEAPQPVRHNQHQHHHHQYPPHQQQHQEPMVHMTEVEVKQEDDGAKNAAENGLDLLGLEFSEIDHDDGGQNNVFCSPQSPVVGGQGDCNQDKSSEFDFVVTADQQKVFG